MRTRKLVGLAVLVSLSGAFGDRVMAPPGTNSLYEYREGSREGIGKFYCGRELARVMGHEAADWLERPERNTEEDTDRLVDALRFKPGELVADLGAGTGYVTRRIARRVSPGGRVYAVDIQPEMLVQLTNRLTGIGLTNVTPVLGTEREPRLPTASVDTVLLVDVYHELEFPREMMDAICRALKPGGRVVLVEFRAEDPDVPIKPLHKMTEAQVKRELAVGPCEWVETIRILPWQHIIVFRKRG